MWPCLRTAARSPSTTRTHRCTRWFLLAATAQNLRKLAKLIPTSSESRSAWQSITLPMERLDAHRHAGGNLFNKIGQKRTNCIVSSVRSGSSRWHLHCRPPSWMKSFDKALHPRRSRERRFLSARTSHAPKGWSDQSLPSDVENIHRARRSRGITMQWQATPARRVELPEVGMACVDLWNSS